MRMNVVTLMSTLFTQRQISIHPAWCQHRIPAQPHIFMDALAGYKATVKEWVWILRWLKSKWTEASSHLRTSTHLCKTNFTSWMKLMMSTNIQKRMNELMVDRVNNCTSALKTCVCRTLIWSKLTNISSNSGIVTWTISRMRPMRTSVESSLHLVEFPKEPEAATLITNTKHSFNKCFSKDSKRAVMFLYQQKTIN